MDSLIREQGSATPLDPKRFLVDLPILASIIHWMTSLFKLTAEEQDEAGIYLGRPRDE